MPAQIAYRAKNRKNQAVFQPRRKPPKGFAPSQGGGKPGRPSSNQIRKVLSGRVHGVAVMQSTGTGKPRHNAQGNPGRTDTTPASATRRMDNVGSSRGRSNGAARAFPRPRARRRSQVAG